MSIFCQVEFALCNLWVNWVHLIVLLFFPDSRATYFCCCLSAKKSEEQGKHWVRFRHSSSGELYHQNFWEPDFCRICGLLIATSFFLFSGSHFQTKSAFLTKKKQSTFRSVFFKYQKSCTWTCFLVFQTTKQTCSFMWRCIWLLKQSWNPSCVWTWWLMWTEPTLGKLLNLTVYLSDVKCYLYISSWRQAYIWTNIFILTKVGCDRAYACERHQRRGKYDIYTCIYFYISSWRQAHIWTNIFILTKVGCDRAYACERYQRRDKYYILRTEPVFKAWFDTDSIFVGYGSWLIF